MARDPRIVLGVGPNATEAEITRAYREKAKMFHPDLNPNDNWSAERMMEINSAYEQLKRECEVIRAEEAIPPMERTRFLLDTCQFEQAAELLGSMPPPRNAEWFCLSAIAAYGLGDGKAALTFAKKAVSLRPESAEYQKVLRNVKSGERASRRRMHTYTTPVLSCGTFFVLLILAALVLVFLFSPLASSLRWWQN